MQVTETLSDGLRRGFTVVVPAADIETRRSARLAELGRTVRLPGFRPGKVPASVVRQRFGTAVSAEVLEESVSNATQQVLTDRGLRPAGQPKVDLVDPSAVTTAGPAQDLAFKVELELLPDITLPDLSTVEITRPRAEPDEATIGRALDDIARRQRELTEVTEPRAAARGEVLTVDFKGSVDGTPFQGGTGTDMDVEVAGPGFIPGFTEQLEGMAPGESRTLNVTFPAEYGVPDLAGKDAVFEVTAKKLKQATYPAVDEALATKLGFDDLEDLRKAVSGQFQREYDQLARLRTKRQLLDALAARADFPVPSGMVDAEFNQIWQRIEQERKEGRVDSDDAGKDEETLRSEYRAIAERRVRLGLLLSEIGRQNGVAVSPDEMTRAMRAEAARYPGQEQTVLEFFRKNPQAAEALRGPIFEEKVVDFVLELAKVTDVTMTPEELAKEPEEAGQTAGSAG